MTLDLRWLKHSDVNLSLPYTFFGRYRQMLARELLDLDLNDMVGFGGETPWPDPETEPVVYLLDHSDCDGWLYQWQCERLAPVMRAFRPLKWSSSWASTHYRITEIVTQCARNGGVVMFS